MMHLPSQAIVEQLRNNYPTGCRVKLDTMDDPHAPEPGTEGTVLGVDDIGSIMVAWDNGCTLSVALGADKCSRIQTNSAMCIIQFLHFRGMYIHGKRGSYYERTQY